MNPMAEKELALCDECGSLFFKGSSQMMGLCQNVPMFSMATRIVTIIFRMAGVSPATGMAQRACTSRNRINRRKLICLQLNGCRFFCGGIAGGRDAGAFVYAWRNTRAEVVSGAVLRFISRCDAFRPWDRQKRRFVAIASQRRTGPLGSGICGVGCFIFSCKVCIYTPQLRSGRLRLLGNQGVFENSVIPLFSNRPLERPPCSGKKAPAL